MSKYNSFTHDALPIAREIIAMELELVASSVNGESENGLINTVLDVTKMEGPPTTDMQNDFPSSDLAIIGLEDPAQPVKQLNNELVYQQHDDFPLKSITI